MFCQLVSGSAFIGQGDMSTCFSEPLCEVGRSFNRGYNAAFLNILFSTEPEMIEWLLNN